jgi:predicted nuclease with TOPRIM domain
LLNGEIDALANHINAAYTKTKDYNALWKYFGVAQIGVFKPEEASIGEKIDLLMKEVASLKTQREEKSGSISDEAISDLYQKAMHSLSREQFLQDRLEALREHLSGEKVLKKMKILDADRKEIP